DQVMRFIAAALVLVAACKTAPPTLPAVGSIWEGRRMAVAGPQNVGVGGPELAAQYLYDDVVADLRSEGIVVAEGGLTLVIESFERSLVKASVQNGGREIQRFDVSADALGCVSSMWGFAAGDNARCFSTGLVSQVVESKPVLLAAGGPAKPTTPTAAPADPAPQHG